MPTQTGQTLGISATSTVAPEGREDKTGLMLTSMSPSLFRAMFSALSVCSAILLPAAGVCAVLAAERLEAGDRIKSGCSSCRIVKQLPLHASLSLSNTRVIHNTRTLSPLTEVSHLSQMSCLLISLYTNQHESVCRPACSNEKNYTSFTEVLCWVHKGFFLSFCSHYDGFRPV